MCVCMCVICSIRDLHITLSSVGEFGENPLWKDRTFLMELHMLCTTKKIGNLKAKYALVKLRDIS